jgi:hypothetical protein
MWSQPRTGEIARSRHGQTEFAISASAIPIPARPPSTTGPDSLALVRPRVRTYKGSLFRRRRSRLRPRREERDDLSDHERRSTQAGPASCAAHASRMFPRCGFDAQVGQARLGAGCVSGAVRFVAWLDRAQGSQWTGTLFAPLLPPRGPKQQRNQLPLWVLTLGRAIRKRGGGRGPPLRHLAPY